MPLRSLLSLLAPPLCAACGASAGRAEPLCPPCRRALRRLGDDLARAGPAVVWAPLAYEGGARALVRALKFRGAEPVATVMAAQIAAAAPPGLIAGALVPVPLHPSRLRKRGYNQAERIASALAGRTGLPLADCLDRTGPRATQVGRDRTARLAGIAGTVGLRPGFPAPPRATLVDDVMTTGATLAAAAAVLVQAGTEVTAVVYARTPGR